MELKKLGHTGSLLRGDLLDIKAFGLPFSRGMLILRYVNDKRSFVSTIIVVSIEIYVLLLSRLFGRLKVLWIVHNIDKETKVFWPKLNTLRRNLYASLADGYGVTHDNLRDVLPNHINTNAKKVISVTFGIPSSHFEKGNALVPEVDGIHENIILVYGSAADKSVHFDKVDYLCDLFDKLEKSDFRIVFCGPLNESIRIKLTYSKHRDRFIIYDGYYSLDTEWVINNVKFILKSYDDISTPYSIFTYCKYSKPIITFNMGFLADLVKRYSLGIVLSENESKDFQLLSSYIANRSEIDYRQILTENSWHKGAQNILAFYEEVRI